MQRANAWFSRPVSAFLITLATLFATACNDEAAEVGVAESAVTRTAAQQRIDDCAANNTTDTARKACIQAAGYTLFDDSAMETGDSCIPGCICVTGENCPCCDTGSIFKTVFWPRPTSGVSPPTAPVTEQLSIDVDRVCIGKTVDKKAPVTVQTRSTSRLAPFVDLEVGLPGAKLVAATVSDSGRYHDDRAGDSVLGGLGLVTTAPPEGCYDFADCHFGCEGEWVYPEPGSGWGCPANTWWGIGCLKLTSCSFGCGTSSSLGPIVQPATNIFTLQ